MFHCQTPAVGCGRPLSRPITAAKRFWRLGSVAATEPGRLPGRPPGRGTPPSRDCRRPCPAGLDRGLEIRVGIGVSAENNLFGQGDVAHVHFAGPVLETHVHEHATGLERVNGHGAGDRCDQPRPPHNDRRMPPEARPQGRRPARRCALRRRCVAGGWFRQIPHGGPHGSSAKGP